MQSWFSVRLVALTALLLLMSSTPSDVDVVVLKNGDRITGMIVKMEKNSLEIDPDYSGVMSIDWDAVRSVRADRPMSIRLHGDADLPPGDIGKRAGDRIVLHSLDEGGPIRLEDVRNINMAEQDYRGYFNIGGNQIVGELADTSAEPVG